MIEDIPLEAIKYPTPNVIKKTGFDLVEVRIGDNISLKLLPNKFVTNVSIKLLDHFKYVQTYPINVIVGMNDKNRKNDICPGRTNISGRQNASQNLLKKFLFFFIGYSSDVCSSFLLRMSSTDSLIASSTVLALFVIML